MLVVSQERFNFVKSKKNEYFPLFWGRLSQEDEILGKIGVTESAKKMTFYLA